MFKFHVQKYYRIIEVYTNTSIQYVKTFLAIKKSTKQYF